MTQIDFYILPDDNSIDPQTYACRLIEKVYRLGHHMHVHCGNDNELVQMDEKLWRHGPATFLPHNRVSEASAALSPIMLGTEPPPEEHGEILVNLSGDVPPFFSRFRRVAEIVPGLPEHRTKSRENYLFYKERGYPLNTHSIKSSAR